MAVYIAPVKKKVKGGQNLRLTHTCYVIKMDYVQASENTISRCMVSCEGCRNCGAQGLHCIDQEETSQMNRGMLRFIC